MSGRLFSGLSPFVFSTFFMFSGFCFLAQSSDADSPILILNAPQMVEKEKNSWIIDPHPQSLPRNWRALFQLRASGSGQFSQKQWISLVRELKTRVKVSEVIDVDLRQESHGFVDEYAVSWYIPQNSENWGKSKREVERSEEESLRALRHFPENIILSQFLAKGSHQEGIGNEMENWKKKQVSISFPKKVISEQSTVTEVPHVRYLRIPVPDFHAPADAEVDQFIAEMKKVTPEQWVHFHCSAGRGRTTTFLAMYDSFKNFSKASLQEIIRRQKQAGGVDLISFERKPSEVKNEWAAQRAQFIQEFYRYCQSEGPRGYVQSWSHWKKSQGSSQPFSR